MKILIIILGRIGDMILSTPMFSAIKKKFPDCRIHILAGRANHSIIRNNPYVDKIIVFDKTPNKLIGILLKLRKERYDYLIDPKDHYSRESNFLARLINARTKIGFNIEGKKIYDFGIPSFVENHELHYINRCFLALEPLDIFQESSIPKPELFPSSDSIQYVENFLNHLTPSPSPKERGDREELSSLVIIDSSKITTDEYGNSINHLTPSPSPKERGEDELINSKIDKSNLTTDQSDKSIYHLTPVPSPKERGEDELINSKIDKSNQTTDQSDKSIYHLTPVPSPKERGEDELINSKIDKSNQTTDQSDKSIYRLTPSSSPKERGEDELINSKIDKSNQTTDQSDKSIYHLAPSPSPKERGEDELINSKIDKSNQTTDQSDKSIYHFTPSPSPKERGEDELINSKIDKSNQTTDQSDKSIYHLTPSPSPKERGEDELINSKIDKSNQTTDQSDKSMYHLTPSPSPKERGEIENASPDAPLLWRGAGGEVPIKSRKLIVINLSAGSPERIWQAEKWLSVITNIDREKFKIIISYAPAEASQAKVLSENATDISLFPSRNLDDVIALISRVDLIFTPDTSLVHVASAFNMPILGLFTSNEDVYKKFHPLSYFQEVIFPDIDSYDIHNIRPEQVIEAFDKLRELI